MRDALGRLDTVAVFGGTSDIGLAIARALAASCGAEQVVLVGRDRARLREAEQHLAGTGLQVEIVGGFDAADPDGHAAVVKQVYADRDVDVSLLAFGVLGEQAAAERDPDRALEVARVNYLGVLSLGLRLAQAIEDQGHGDVVLLSSVAGERGRRANYVYGSSKAGADVFAQGLGDRLRTAGGHVLVARPGFVHTSMTAGRDAAPFATTPEEVAEDVAAALRRRAEVVYSPRIVRLLMVVLRHLPRGLFRLVAGR